MKAFRNALADGRIVGMEFCDITPSDRLRCPHYIVLPDHYRADGSCRCNDPDHTIMRAWGCKWNNGAWR